MIQVRIDGGAVQWSAAVDHHSIVGRFDICAHALQVFGHDSNTVRLLDLELGSVLYDGCPFCKGGEHGDDRKLVDQGRDQLPLYRCGMQGRRTDQQIGTWLCAVGVFIYESDIAAHCADDTQHSVTGRIDADIFQEYLRARYEQCCGDKVGGGRDVAGYVDLLSNQPWIRKNRGSRALALDVRAKVAKHQLGVIAGYSRLSHRGWSICIQSGEQHTRFDLRGGDR